MTAYHSEPFPRWDVWAAIKIKMRTGRIGNVRPSVIQTTGERVGEWDPPFRRVTTEYRMGEATYNVPVIGAVK